MKCEEPVVLLAFIEHDLQCTNSQGQQTDAPVIYARGLPRDVRRVEDEQ